MSTHPKNTPFLLPDFSEVAARLKSEGFRKVSTHSSGVSCCCPFHEDQNPSLSIFLSPAGKLGFKCHAGCEISTERWKTLLKASGAWQERSDTWSMLAIHRHSAAVYRYGESLIKTRAAAKNDRFPFAWYHEASPGEYRPGAGGLPIPLYHAADLAERPEDTVLIFEGEKDCDNARDCPGLHTQFVILSLPYGAAGRLKPHQGQALQDRNVVICYDLDDAGRRGAEQLATDLASAYNCRARIIQPRAETGKDFSDWINQYGKAGAVELVLAAEKVRLRRVIPSRPKPLQVVEKPNADGLYTAICALGMDFRYNERAARMELCIDGLWLAFNDRYQSDLRHQMEEQFQYHTQRGLRPLVFGRERWWLITNALANRKTVDPFVTWLGQLPAWDGTPRLDALLDTCFGANAADPLVRWSSWYILGAAITRAYEPGYKFDTLPILIGPQGSGKSTFLRELLPRHLQPIGFSDSLRLDGSRKEQVEAILGAILCEVPEMTGNTRANVDQLKRFLSAQNDYGIRLAYRRNPEDLPRRCILVGTSNHRDCIPSDPTGYRRFVPVEVPRGRMSAIVEYLDMHRDQLWAETLHSYHLGAQFYLHGTLEKTAGQLAEKHRVADDFYEAYVQKLDPRQSGTLLELAHACGLAELRPDGTIRPLTRVQQMAFAQALNICSWSKRQRRTEAGRRWIWKR